MASIVIPIRDSEEVVEVRVDELPEDEEDVIAILQNELAPLDIWRQFAVEYYRQGKAESFSKMLEPIMDLHNQSSEKGKASALFDQFEGAAPGQSPEVVKKSFLAILNALAAFHTVLGSQARDKPTKKAEFQKANKYYEACESVDILAGAANVGKAVLQLAKGELGRAEKTLNEVDAFHKNSLPALLSKACAKYNGGNFREALKLYREVFKVNNNPPAPVRLGLGYCYNQLGQPRLAQRTFERTLELQPDNVHAMVGLAVLWLNDDKVEKALEMLKRAYELEPFNPSVLNHLANHYFYTGAYEKTEKLAERAYKHSDAKSIRAESCYHLARSYHAQGDYQKALQWYSESFKSNPDYLAPQFGLGQMHLVNDDPRKAIQCFERVLRAQPSNTDALKALGHLYAREGRHADALAKLTAASEQSSGDAAVWLELGQLQQVMPNGLPAALKAYEKAAGILKKPPSTVPSELWNNLGSIRHRLGKLDSAEQAYCYAIRVACRAGGDAYGARCVTTQFNLGRLYEERGDVPRAVAQYKAILAAHPNYPGAFLRLAACEQQAGRLPEAIGWNQKELSLHPKSPVAWASMGNSYLAGGDLKRADNAFKTVLKDAEELDGKDCKRDPYALGQLAWIQLQLAVASSPPSAPLLAACASASGVDRVDKAAEMLRKILEKDASNLYAANGLGVVCVAKGRLHEARSIFTQVREASVHCDTATLNLGQLSAALGEHATAVSLYDTLIKRAKGQPAGAPQAAGAPLLQLLLLLARSHYDAGKLADCRLALEEAVTVDPTSHAAWHNLGLALLTSARHSGGPDAPPRKGADVAAAIADATRARKLYLALNPELAAEADAAMPDDAADAADAGAADGLVDVAGAAAAAGAAEVARAEKSGLTLERRKAALRLCKILVGELSDEEEAAREKDANEEAAVAAADAKMREYEAIRKAAEEAAKAREREAEEAQERAIAEQKAKLAAKMEAWKERDARAAADAAAGERRKKRRKGEGGSDDEADAVASDDDAPGSAGGGAGGDGGDGDAEADADAEADLFGSDDDDGGDGGAKPADADADAAAEDDLFGSDADDDAAAGDGGGAGAGDAGAEGGGSASAPIAKRRKIVAEDEDEEDVLAGGAEEADGAEGGGGGAAATAAEEEAAPMDAAGGGENDAAAADGGAAASRKRRVVDDDDDD